ncbi:PucR family transcriptional regulator [Nocardia sp. NBC_00416]|uniref:PucR family transcriptional regulator n=1 Tax=Nocardia sp. NBC_00416 TaxID=2975991 RepID=UPI002E217385
MLKSREDEISSGMSALMARDIDHLDDDPRLLDMLEASVAGNVATVIDVLINDIPIERLEPDPAAVEYALRLAQREVPVNSLVRAYHMGQQEMLRICYGELDRGELPAPLALAVVERLTEIIYGYIDWITGYVFDAYEAERTRWVDTRGSVRSSTVHSVLSADNPDISAFEHETGYPLGREHLALILWREGPEQASALDLLETRVRAIGPLLHTDGPAIVTAIDRRTVWAWLPFGRRPTADVTEIRSTCDLSEGVRLAVGLPGHGPAGFRRSHLQARAAYFVATVPGAPDLSSAVGFADPGVGVISLLATDLDATRSWVQEVLGDLAEDTAQAATLRHTLSTYYATGDNHVQTAQTLTLHRNTVKYRIAKAVEVTRTSGPARQNRRGTGVAGVPPPRRQCPAPSHGYLPAASVTMRICRTGVRPVRARTALPTGSSFAFPVGPGSPPGQLGTVQPGVDRGVFATTPHPDLCNLHHALVRLWPFDPFPGLESVVSLGLR